ncbi:MAG: ribosome silencing factor [Candidatus Omnitrophica bacterium]|nr:ribosome silencing factor [Candidatus Omnitrophota bacterium]
MEEIEAKELAISIARIAKENKAQKIIVLDLRRLSAFSDFFVIISGTSGRHIAGLADTIEEGLNKEKINSLFRGSSSKNPESGWIVLDYASVVVHIFQKPQREFYSLEHLWQEAKRVKVPSGKRRNGKRQSLRGSRISNKRLSKKPKLR